MEQFDQPLDSDMTHLGDSEGRGLKVTDSLRQSWKILSGWAMFFAILLFIMAGIVMLGFLASFALVARSGSIMAPIFMGLYGALMITIGLYLYRFASSLKRSLYSNSTEDIEASALNFGKYYRMMGIITVLILGLYVLLFAVGIGGSMF